MTAIPEDLRQLKDFPTYDTTFQDGPCFRQNLAHWALKTDKIGTELTNLADAFERFHSSGLQHFEAASQIIQGLQALAGQCENNKGNTISGPLQQFSDVLGKIWCYYEAFLGQTLMLNAEPIRELAKSFTNLKKLYEELLSYRKEYVLAAEKLCACRHVSKLTDKATFTTLTETCHTAQKTYQLVLSKYVVCLREANTKDMVSFLRRVIEHLLSLYSYHNYSTQMLKDLEPTVNDLFTKTKDWQLFYNKELLLWNQLSRSIQKHVLADFQHNMGLLPSQSDATTTWTDVALVPITATTQLGRNVFRPILRILPTGVHPTRDSKHGAQTPPPEWGAGTTEEEEDGSSNLDFQPRKSSLLQRGSPKHIRRHLPIARTYSIPIADPDTEVDYKKRLRAKRKLIRSISDPDIIASKSVPTPVKPPLANGDIHHKAIHSSLRDAGTSTGAPIREVGSPPVGGYSREEFLLRTSSTSSFSAPFRRPIKAVLRFHRGKHKDKEEKKLKKLTSGSLDDITTSSETRNSSGTVTPEETPPPEGSPAPGRKGKGSGIFKKARASLLHLVSQEKGEQQQQQQNSTSPPSQPLDLSVISEGKAIPLRHPSLSSSQSGNSTSHRGSASPDSSERSLLSPKQSHMSSSPSPTHSPVPLRRMTMGEEELGNLQDLVLPAVKSWLKSGYLWLRMKLPNNRYAWTHIYCVVDRVLGQLMIQEQSLPEPRKLENLLLCSTKLCTPDFIDRNYCFRVISPTSEHLFQAVNEQQAQQWVSALKETTEETLKNSDSHTALSATQQQESEGNGSENVPEAMSIILAVPGNNQCADCYRTEVEWASVNLGIVLCIACSGIHRGLGVHVSKVRSLNLDKWDRLTVEFMQTQGNTKSNSYYEATLGQGFYSDVRKPPSNARKEERLQFIRQKYVSLEFVPESDERTTNL